MILRKMREDGTPEPKKLQLKNYLKCYRRNESPPIVSLGELEQWSISMSKDYLLQLEDY